VVSDLSQKRSKPCLQANGLLPRDKKSALTAARQMGCGGRILRLRRKILLLFGEKSLKHFVSIHLFSKLAQHHIPSQPGSSQDWRPARIWCWAS
jgi:hypothetical protein